MQWILLAVFAGICNGTFALPMKFTAKWNWENIWSAFTVWGFVIFPVLLGIITIPNLLAVFLEVDSMTLFLIFLFGFMWGIGSICFGLGISYIGIGLAYSINIGMTIAIGSLLPLFPGVADLSSGSKSVMLVVAGVLIIIAGVILNGYSAFLRGKDMARSDANKSIEAPRRHVSRGLIVCVVAGLMSPMLQVAFMYGGEIVRVAGNLGVSNTMAPNAVWIVALFGGFVVNLFYTGILLRRNNSWKLYKISEARNYHLLAMLMGFLWIVTIACYGIAVSNMGELGLSVGWAIFNSVGIVCANIFGILTKEWKDVRQKTMNIMILGTLVLILGTCIVALAEGIGTLKI